MATYLDTHVVVWAYAGETERFPGRVCERIEHDDLLVSPLVLLELQYLQEIGRLTVDPGLIFENLASSIGLKICELSMMRVVSEAMLQAWTRDPFDRMIVAAARARDASLISKDQHVLANYAKAFWE